jgi:hypothetical protein
MSRRPGIFDAAASRRRSRSSTLAFAEASDHVEDRTVCWMVSVSPTRMQLAITVSMTLSGNSLLSVAAKARRRERAVSKRVERAARKDLRSNVWDSSRLSRWRS